MRNYFYFRLKGAVPEERPLEEIKKELINELVLRALVENWASQMKTQSPPPVLTKEERERFSKPASLFRALKEHKNYLSLYSLLLKELSKGIKAPPLKTQKTFYQKNRQSFILPASCRLKQIMVKKEKLIQTLEKRLREGESFDQLSRLHSLQRHPGWVKKGSLKLFDRACFGHGKRLSPIMKSPYGYHIFLVEEKRPEQKKSFPQVQNHIIQLLKTDSVKTQFQSWLKKETSQTTVWTNKKLMDKIHIQHRGREI